MTARRRAGRALVAVAVAAAVTAAGLLSVPAASAAVPTGCTPHPVTCPHDLQFGAAVANSPRASAEMAAFSSLVGHRPSIDMYFQSWNDTFDTTAATAVADAGMTPMVTWEAFDPDHGFANPYPLHSIAYGTFDSYIASEAQRMKAFGRPVIVRFLHEMNGDWYPWGQGINGNTAVDEIAAWRHVHDVFAAQGATNVIWLWAPNLVDAKPKLALSTLYPGDQYVDWVGVSGYYQTTADTFANRFPVSLAQLDLIAPTKPILIGETGVAASLAGRIAQITDLVKGAAARPRVIGFVWFNLFKRMDWSLDAAGGAALGAALDKYGFATGTGPLLPVLEAPRALTFPSLSGTAQVGSTLTGTGGTWLSMPESGQITGQADTWMRCATPDATGSCAPTGTAGATYLLTGADANRYVRYRSSATNGGGTAYTWSPPSLAVLTVPAAPGVPTVTSRHQGVLVTFPPAPAGTTHWRVVVNDQAQPLVPVGQPSLTIDGLTDGPSYTMSLQAADVAGDRRLFSAAVNGTFAAIATPAAPAVRAVGSTVTVGLPPAPRGTHDWVLAFDGATRIVPGATRRIVLRAVRPGRAHRWALQASAGSWSGGRFGSRTAAIHGSVTPLGGRPSVRATVRRGQVLFTFRHAPAGTKSFLVTVGKHHYRPVPVSRHTFRVVKLHRHHRYTWTVRASRANAVSTAATGRVRL